MCWELMIAFIEIGFNSPLDIADERVIPNTNITYVTINILWNNDDDEVETC